MFSSYTVKGISKTSIPRMDILFVVDSSGSMLTHQEELIRNINTIAASLSGQKSLDYRVAVVQSSDTSYTESLDSSVPLMDRVCILPNQFVRDPELSSSDDCEPGYFSTTGGESFLTGSDPNFVSRLSTRLRVGGGGSGMEKFFDPVVATLENDKSSNTPFLRKDAHLAVIFLTDTDDQSEIVKSATQFYFKLQSLKSQSWQIHLHGAIPLDYVEPWNDGERTYPVRLKQAINLTQGMMFDINSKEYGAHLSSLAELSKRQALSKIFIPLAAKSSSIEVQYDGEVLANDKWNFSRENGCVSIDNSIVTDAMVRNAALQVSYEL